MSAIVFIPIGKGKVTVIDFEDKEKVCRYSWHLSDSGYAIRRQRNDCGVMQNVRLHRYILDAEKGQECDHKNLDKLDNRRSNLRFCSKSQNQYNITTRKNKASNLPKGVFNCRHSTINPFLAQIEVNGKKKYLGLFPTPEEAKAAYDKASIEIAGEFHRS